MITTFRKKILLLVPGALLLISCGAPRVSPTALTAETRQPAQVATASIPMATDSTLRSLTVKIDSGELEGVSANGVLVFKGIPYAAPPVGELRWREPQSPAPWQGVRKANAFGDSCMQKVGDIAGAGVEGPIGEDCLYVNVWTPTTTGAPKLPVMVWIHGGALVIGSGSLSLYDGAALAQRGAVVVTLNYRLGPLGFFTHPALDREDPGGPVNFGLYDQIAALKWVQRNIAAFGGDANNVTILGESAGAQSVLTLFASPLARGLFHKGVAESSYAIPIHTRASAQKVGIAVASAVGLNGAEATVEELRAVPADKFASVTEQGTSLAPVFVQGDPAVPEPILDAFQKGRQAAVPLILGNNSDEATVAVAFGIDAAKLIEKLGLAKIAVKALYPGVSDNDTLGRDLIRDLLFMSWVKRIADLHAQTAPSWRYYFTYVPVNRRATEPGVPHGGEIVFVFGTGDVSPLYKDGWTEADRAMSKRVGDYWFEFARTGKPQPAGEPVWAQASSRSDETMEFGDTIALRTGLDRRRLDVYIDLLAALGTLLGRE